MKKLYQPKKIAIVFAICNICFCLDWSGYLSTDNRFFLKKDFSISFEEYRLCFTPQQSFNERVKFYSEFWLRTFGLPGLQYFADLTDRNKISPFDIELREAYIDLNKFPFSNMDIRIGKQRIVWGTADKINPTDNLNPDDLEDIWDFGRHSGSNGIKIDGYVSDFSISYVFLPNFTPAILPENSWLSASNMLVPVLPGITIRTVEDSLAMPEYTIKNSINGIKIKRNFFGFDFSLSYVYGRDDIPIIKKTAFVPVGLTEVDIHNEFYFPRMQVIGADLAGAVGDIGLWAEAGLFLPESTSLVIDMTQLGMGTMDTLILDRKPYVKYVFGLDYTFKNGLYINLQYAHGFFHERGKMLEDYILTGLEWKLFAEELNLMPLNTGIEIRDFSDIKNNYAIVYAPEISYKPVEDCEVTLGTRLIDGVSETLFGQAKDRDEVLVRIKYNF